MSVAALGSLLGGYEQGQERAQQQKERAQYLLMLQQRNSEARQEKSDDAEAGYKANMAAYDATDPDVLATDTPAGTQGSTLGTMGEGGPPVQNPRVFGPNSAPISGPGAPQRPGPAPGAMPPGGTPPGGGPGGAPAMPPGAASIPPQPPQQMAMPGAQPMPGPGGPPPGGMPPPQQMPQRPMPPPGGPQPMGGPPQGQPRPQPLPGQQGQPGPQGTSQGQPAPQQPPTPESVMAGLQQVQQQMQTPVAQRVLSDPGVKAAHDATNAFVAGLKKDNVGFGPGQTRPNAVQMKEFQMLHQRTELATTKAAQALTKSDTEAVTLGGHMASLLFSQERLQQQASQFTQRQEGMDRRADARNAGGGGAGAKPWDQLSDDERGNAEEVIKYMASHNGNQPTRIDKSTQALMPTIRAEIARRGGAEGNFQADATQAGGEIKAKQQSLAANDKMLTKLRPAFQALDANYKALLKDADAVKVPDNQPAAKFKNYLLTKMGSEGYSNLNRWTYDVQNEMAQLASAGSNVVAIQRVKDAQALIDHAQTAGQLRAGYKQMVEAAGNIVSAREDESKKLGKEVNDAARSPMKGKSGGVGGAPKAEDAAGFMGADGTIYSDADVKHAMQVTGKSRKEVMELAGVK